MKGDTQLGWEPKDTRGVDRIFPELAGEKKYHRQQDKSMLGTPYTYIYDP